MIVSTKKTMTSNDWTYKGEPVVDIPDKKIAFVYLITQKSSGKRYIGKKLFFFTKTKTVGGKKKRVKSESDWRTYWSSSKDVQEAVEKFGESDFTREILLYCENKGTASYIEAKYQMMHEVLENQDKWWNKQIQCRVHHTHVKLK